MEIVIKSLASAVITGIILIIAKYVSPTLAGAVGGVPIVFAISYVILTLEDRTVSKEFLLGGIWGAVAAIFFSLVLIWLNGSFAKFYWLNFVIAYVACFIVAYILVQLTTK